jgi:hypothetical protein
MNTKKSKSLPIQANDMEPVVAELAKDTVETEPSDDAIDSAEKLVAKKSKSQKNKVIRDSFSFPEHDYRKISELKKTCLALGIHVKKSEVLRAGLNLLTQVNSEELKKAVENVEKVQTGRPSSAID